MKLYVNTMRYWRFVLKPTRVVRRDSRNLRMEELRDTRKLRLDVPVMIRKKRGKEVWMEKKGKKFFVDVVRGA